MTSNNPVCYIHNIPCDFSFCNRSLNKFFNLSRKYKLCVSGGSDYHGRHIGSDNLSIGSYGLNEECLNKFINFDKRK